MSIYHVASLKFLHRFVITHSSLFPTIFCVCSISPGAVAEIWQMAGPWNVSHWYARLNLPWLIHDDSTDVCRQLK